MKLALIWAMAENRTIGRDNALPWHLPEDLKFFKRVTMGKPIIMGRKTWDSIGRPLPGRTSIVITRDPRFQAEGAVVVHTLDEAIAAAQRVGSSDSEGEACVIGGADIFRLALPRADRLYLTQVHAVVDGDVFFPAFDPSGWQERQRDDHAADENNPYSYSFIVLDKSPT